MKVAQVTPTVSKRAGREDHPTGATPRRTFLEIMHEGRQRPTPAVASPAPAPTPSPAGRDVARFVERVGASEARVDALLEAAARGKTFKPAELIAMQVTVFRYSQTVELLSRGADKLVGAVKQTLGTQV